MGLKLLTVSSIAMDREQARAVAELCGEVFNVDYARLMDLCPVRTHVLGYADEQLVSHALWLDRRIRIGEGQWFTAAYVEGVATHPGYRERGYGRAAMRRLQDAISSYPLGVLSPAAESWYVKLGWERWLGPLWIDHDGDHRETPDETVLVYRTPKTLALDLSLPLTAEWRPFELW